MKHLWLILVSLTLSTGSLGQNYSTASRKAIKRFKEASACFELRDDACAAESLQKALKADPEFVEALQMLAQVKFDQGEVKDAIGYFKKSLEINPLENPDGFRLLAGLMVLTGDYNGGLKEINMFLSFPPQLVRKREEGLLIKDNCLFAMNALEHPVPFQPENLGEAINSEYSEYWPSLSVDEQMLMFTVMMPVDSNGGNVPQNLQEDFFYSRYSMNSWEPRKNAGAPLNTQDNEGAHTMTADGKTLFFTACNRSDGRGMCDLYQSTWKDGNWSIPRNLGTPVNSMYSEKHPTVSADGRRLYFTSNKPGGKGSYDIWMSVRTGDKWSEPLNLGDSINTVGVEQSPFIHPDQQSLYFSSTGWPGMGQGDLFLSRMLADSKWSEPENLGYPINTWNDEIGLTVNARGDRAYFASDRGEGTDTDLFSFEMPLNLRPVLVSYMKGRIYDSRNLRGIGAILQLIDLASEEVVMELESSENTGEYLISLPTDRDYALNVSAGGYLFHSEHFTFSGTHGALDPLRLDISMERIMVGSTVVLHNIFFETDSHLLQNESMAELNKVYEFMLKNPSIEVEISGHTDNTGSPEHNQELSESRAHAVVKYLTSKGIQVEKLNPAGYGEKAPVADNETEEGRTRNRRTELKIIQVHPEFTQ